MASTDTRAESEELGRTCGLSSKWGISWHWLPLFLLLATVIGDAHTLPARRVRHKVLLVSFDGFRWDYYGHYPTPNLDEMRRNGVHARVGLRPAFTTKTFPNHYTLATGLYEESHGILDNEMYDPVFNEYFTLATTDPKWWIGGEPLWITATKQGLKAGVYFWPGGNIPFPPNNVRPHFYVPYNMSIPFRSRVDTIVDWFIKGDADVVIAYFHEPDESGHQMGAFSNDVARAVAHVDETLGYLTSKLNESRVLQDMDLIVLSDHGMTNRSGPDYLIDLSTIPGVLEKVDKVIPKTGPVLGLNPKSPADREWLVKELKRAGKRMTVYRKEDIPEEYHYRNNRRVLPLILVADEGYVITRYSKDTWEMIGWHGYNNRLNSMRPIFFARGPDFRTGLEFNGTVENVNVYPLVCHLLGIRPAPNNGTLRAWTEVLSYNNASTTLTYLGLTIASGLAHLVSTLRV